MRAVPGISSAGLQLSASSHITPTLSCCNRGYTDGCQDWDKADSDLDDWKLNMGRACSLMSLIFGCILTFFAFFKQCLCPLSLGQKLINISGAMVQISLCLTWPVFRTSVCDLYGCSWGGGATALLFTQLFFFAASIFSRCMRESRYERMKERREERNDKRKDDKEERKEEAKDDNNSA